MKDDDIIESIVDKIQQLPFQKKFTIADLAGNCDENKTEFKLRFLFYMLDFEKKCLLKKVK